MARSALPAEDRVSRGMAVVLIPSLNGGGFDIFETNFAIDLNARKKVTNTLLGLIFDALSNGDDPSLI